MSRNHRRHPRRARGFLLFGVASMLNSAIVVAAPYRPQDDAMILASIPASVPRMPDATDRVLPPAAAAEIARMLIERFRASGDPRELGHAQAVLNPWWGIDDAPDDILLMRATLQQSQHAFDAALADLDRLLRRRPDHAQAWLTRATVLRVRGEFEPAASACAKLEGQGVPFVAELCSASVQALSGGLSAARVRMDRLAQQRAGQTPAIDAWFSAEQLEMSVRAGDVESATAQARDALFRHPNDLGLLAAQADRLLDQGDPHAVIEMIPADTPADALRLRLALAFLQAGDGRFAHLDALIMDGFSAAHRRGDVPHLREEARYRLATGRDPQEALAVARRNWEIQREPWDLRILLEAAIAAGRADVEAVAWQWADLNGVVDARWPARGPG